MIDIRELRKDPSTYLTKLTRKGAGGLVQELLDRVPNPPADDVPSGGEDDFDVLREIGEKPSFGFAARDPLDLAQAHGWIDAPRGTKVSGSRFIYRMGDLALLRSTPALSAAGSSAASRRTKALGVVARSQRVAEHDAHPVSLCARSRDRWPRGGGGPRHHAFS